VIRRCLDIILAQFADMKLIGFLLLLSGWGIVLAALRMLHGNATSVFIVLGVVVEVLGFVFVARAHLPGTEDRR
jgi:heme/copper-type cytochrome/quinol oxidase subunit 3